MQLELGGRRYGARLGVNRSPAPAPRLPTLAAILVKSGQLQGERLAVRSPVGNIGRADYNDFKFPDPSISAAHAKLQLREGVWMLSDLGSSNGSKVDDEAVTGEMPLPRDTGPKTAAGTLVAETEQPAEAPATQTPPRRRPSAQPAPPRLRPNLILAMVGLGALLLTGYLLLG